MRMRVPRCASICLLAASLLVATAGESNAQRLNPADYCPWAPTHLPGAGVNAQSQFAPYYGKNQIHYDRFDWHTYKTDHFEIYFYPENEQHLARVASYAESAYQQVSSDLRHDLAQRVPLIIFKTHSEFEQQNIAPGAASEGVLAFAEGERHRMVLPIDLPSDLLYGLIVHELTHVFQYDIIPTSLIRRNMPLWVHEGGAEYERGIWDPLDLMMVRDAAVADIIPRMSQMEGYGDIGNSPRLVYNLGHALYEFIETRWGKDGVRQFLFSLRKSAIGGGSSPYEEAFQMTAREFDQQFEKYLKDRFKAFRDKERPADYGQDLSPDPEKSSYTGAISIEPSPSGDLIAIATGNRRDQELDIVLISAKDGSVVRNLTPGFDMDRGFEYLTTPSLFNMVAWMSWSPVGDRIAYFVRQEKYKTLIIQNVLTGKIEQRVNLQTVDNPESPNISPDGRSVLFSGLRSAIGDIFKLDLSSGDITNLTNDEFADYGPVYSPDGSFIVYLARVSGSQKLFRLDVASGKKTQLTFGTQDEAGAKFLNADTLVFPSTATDPTTPLTPEVARNGNIFNLWTLSLKTGELRQFTDALGGVLSPVVLANATTPKLAFVDYYKGSYSLHTFDLKEPLHTAASADFGTPAPITDFQPPLQHTLVAENKAKKGRFDKMFLDGRPPVNVGVTSGGDIFGGSMVSFTDVLGDQQFSMYASSVQQYKTLSFSYVNLSRRFQFALQGYSQTQFYYGELGGYFYDPQIAPFIRREDALATQTVRGGSMFGIYPLSMYRRIEFSGGLVHYSEEYADPLLQSFADEYQQETFGTTLFNRGMMVPLGVSFVQETTVFREYGPLSGSTMRLSYEGAPKVGNSLSRQTGDIDARYYIRLAANGVLALRAYGFKSWGDAPGYTFFGGNSEMRGYDYRQFLGHKAFYTNAELRFPLIHAMATPIGILGGIRGVFFFNFGGAGLEGNQFKVWDNKGVTFNPEVTSTGIVVRPATRIEGFRLVDSRASYGIGLETFALGFPVHFDWSYRTLFNKGWEDYLFAFDGGSAGFRKARFTAWIGYDF
jgi:hypothetical protein